MAFAPCGDNTREAGEECDTGGASAGCSATCTTNANYQCFERPAGGDVCYEICGDGIYLNALPPASSTFAIGGNAACDDGNTYSGDGCSHHCQEEQGANCVNTIGAASVCTFTPTNNNGRHEPPEACDDGLDGGTIIWALQTNINLDGCSNAGVIDAGFKCENGDLSRPSECVEICGDGKNMGSNPCDDNNVFPFDGCDENCQVEDGYSCTGGTPTQYDTCTETCGDGRNIGILACDDGNNNDGDGCSAACAVETGYACSGGSWW